MAAAMFSYLSMCCTCIVAFLTGFVGLICSYLNIIATSLHFPISSTAHCAAFAASIAVWDEKTRLHLSETPDTVILFFHVSELILSCMIF